MHGFNFIFSSPLSYFGPSQNSKIGLRGREQQPEEWVISHVLDYFNTAFNNQFLILLFCSGILISLEVLIGTHNCKLPDTVQAPSRFTIFSWLPMWVIIFSSDIRASFSEASGFSVKVITWIWKSLTKKYKFKWLCCFVTCKSLFQINWTDSTFGNTPKMLYSIKRFSQRWKVNVCVNVYHLNVWESSHKMVISVILGLARNDSSVLRC